MRRLTLLLIVILLIVGLFSGCATPKQWSTLTAFFEEFEDIPGANSIKLLLDGYKYRYSSSKNSDQFAFGDVMIWSHRWGGSINTFSNESQANAVVILKDSFTDEKKRNDFFEQVLDELTIELGEGQKTVDNNDREMISWSNNSVTINLKTAESGKQYDVMVEYSSYKSMG